MTGDRLPGVGTRARHVVLIAHDPMVPMISGASDTDGRVPDLRTLLGAHEVSLLIADYSGRAVVRLGRMPNIADGRTHGSEHAERVNLTGTVYDKVLRTQRAVVREVVQALGAAVLRVTGGDLRYDATVLCLDWYGESTTHDTHHGASQDHASP